MPSELDQMLDRGLAVVVFRNAIGSWTAFAVRVDHEGLDRAREDADGDDHLTDDFSAEKAIVRLADKMLGCGDYQEDKS